MEVVINNYNTGISFTIKVSPYDLVLALKEKIQEQNKVPLEKQNLSFNGAELQNHHALAIFGISEGSTINLFISMDVEDAANMSRLRKEHVNWLKSGGLKNEVGSELAIPTNVHKVLNDASLTDLHSKNYIVQGMNAKTKMQSIPFGLAFADSTSSSSTEEQDETNAIVQKQRRHLLHKVVKVLRSELNELTGEYNVLGNRFSAQLRRRFFVLHEAQIALGCAVGKSQQVRLGIELLSRMKLRLSKPLPLPITMAITATVRGFLLLVNNNDSGPLSSPVNTQTVEKVLQLFTALLRAAPPMSLSDGPNFNPEIVRSMQPLITFVRSFVMSGDKTTNRSNNHTDSKFKALDLDSVVAAVGLEKSIADTLKREEITLERLLEIDDPIILKEVIPSLWDRARLWKHLNTIRARHGTFRDAITTNNLRQLALQLLFDWGLARASVADLLELVNTLLELPIGERGKDATFQIYRHLKIFLAHRVIDGGSEGDVKTASGVKPVEGLLERHHIDLDTQLKSILKDKQPSNESDVSVPAMFACSLILSQLWRLSRPLGDENPDTPAQLYMPLRLHVDARTFQQIIRLLKHCDDAVLTPGTAAKLPKTVLKKALYLQLNTLYILKVHVYQFVESKLSHVECGLTTQIVDQTREILWKLITSPLIVNGEGKGEEKELAEAVPKIAASIITYEFFYESVTHKINYLTTLITKRNTKMAKSQGLTPPEEHVYLLLLDQISSIETGASLTDALCQPQPKSPSVVVPSDSKGTDVGPSDRKERNWENAGVEDIEGRISSPAALSQLRFMCALLDASREETLLQIKAVDKKNNTSVDAKSSAHKDSETFLDSDQGSELSSEKSEDSQSRKSLMRALASYQGHFLSCVLAKLKEATAEQLAETAKAKQSESGPEGKKGKDKNNPLHRTISLLLDILVAYSTQALKHSTIIAKKITKHLKNRENDRSAREFAEKVLNHSLVGGLAHSLCSWICLLLDLKPSGSRVALMRVSNRGGLVVRRGIDLTTPVLGELKDGEIVTILHTKGRRARVHTPIQGWITGVIDGKPTLIKESAKGRGKKEKKDGKDEDKEGETMLVQTLLSEVPLKLVSLASKFMQAMEELLEPLERLPKSTATELMKRHFETEHPYTGVTTHTTCLELMGATEAKISFHKNCKIQDGDTLQLFADEEQNKPITPELKGSFQIATEKGSTWNDLINTNVKTNKVYIVLEKPKVQRRDAKDRESVWGIHVTLAGVTPCDPIAWTHTLAHTSCWMVGCICAKLLVGYPLSEGEQALRAAASRGGGTGVTPGSAGGSGEGGAGSGAPGANIFAKGLSMSDVLDIFPEKLKLLFQGAARSMDSALLKDKKAQSGSNGTPHSLRNGPFALPERRKDPEGTMQEDAFVRDLLAPKEPCGLAQAFMLSMYEQHKDPFRFMIRRVSDDSRAVFRAVLAVLLRHTGRTTQALRIALEHSKAADEGLDHPPLLRRTSSASPASVGLFRLWRAAQTSAQKISILTSGGKDHKTYMYVLLERARLLLHVQPAFRRVQRVPGGKSSVERKGHRRKRDVTKLRGLLKLQQNRIMAKGHKPEDAVIQAILHFLRPPSEEEVGPDSPIGSNKNQRLELMRKILEPVEKLEASFVHDPQCALLWDGLVKQHVRAVVLVAGIKMFRRALEMLRRPSLVNEVLHHLISPSGLVIPSAVSSATNTTLKAQLTLEYFAITNTVTARSLALSRSLTKKSPHNKKFSEKFSLSDEKHVVHQAFSPRGADRKKDGWIRSPYRHVDRRMPLWTLKLYEIGLYNVNLILSDLELLSKAKIVGSLAPLLSLPSVIKLQEEKLGQRDPAVELAAVPWNLRYASWLLFQIIAFSGFAHASHENLTSLGEKRSTLSGQTLVSSLQTTSHLTSTTSPPASILAGSPGAQSVQKQLLDVVLKNMGELVTMKNRHIKASRVRTIRMAKRGRVEKKNSCQDDSSTSRIGSMNVGFSTVFSEFNSGIEYTQVACGIPGFYSTIAKVEAPKGDSCWNAIGTVRVVKGRWYYEVRFLSAPAGGTGAPCYIGWSGKDFSAINNTTGCGDTDDSWSFSPFGPGPSWHRGNQKRYPVTSNPPRAKVGSILGCEIVVDEKQMGEIVWYMDGVCLGVAYTGFKIPSGGIAPAAGLLKGEIEFIFHRSLLKHLPANAMPFEDTPKAPRLDLMSRMLSTEDVGDFEWGARCAEMHAQDAATTWYMHALNDNGFLGPSPKRTHPPSTGEIEIFLTQYLFMVLRCIRFPYVQQIITQSHDWVNALFNIMKAGSCTNDGGLTCVLRLASVVKDSSTPASVPVQSSMATQLVLKLLRVVLPQLDPKHPSLVSFTWDGDKISESKENSSEPTEANPAEGKGCEAVVRFLLHEIGTASNEWYVAEALNTGLNDPASAVSGVEGKAKGKGNGNNSHSSTETVSQKVVATGEYISLCRVLLDSPLWNCYVNAELLRALNGLDKLAYAFERIGELAKREGGKSGNEVEENKKWRRVMRDLQKGIQPIFASLSVLGGYVESIKEGSRVFAPTTDDELILGTVSRLAEKVTEKNGETGKKEKLANVHLDTGVVVVLPPWKLTPAPAQPLTESSAEQQPKIMDLIMAFLSHPLPEFSSTRNKPSIVMRGDVGSSRILSLQLIHTQLRRRCLGVVYELLRIPANVALFVKRSYPTVLRRLALPDSKATYASSKAVERGTIPTSGSNLSVLRGRVLFLEQRLARLTSAPRPDSKTHLTSLIQEKSDGTKSPAITYASPPDGMFFVNTKPDNFSEIKTREGLMYTCANRIPRNYLCSSALCVQTLMSHSRKGRPKIGAKGEIMLGEDNCTVECNVSDANQGLTVEFQVKLDPKKLAKELHSPRAVIGTQDEKQPHGTQVTLLELRSGDSWRNTYTGKLCSPRTPVVALTKNSEKFSGCRLSIIDPEATTFELLASDGKGGEARRWFTVSLREKRQVRDQDVIRFRCKSSKFYLTHTSDKGPLRLAEVGDPGCMDLAPVPGPGDTVRLLFDLSPEQGKGKYLTLNGSSDWKIMPQRDTFVALWNVASSRYLQFNASKKSVSLAPAEEGKGTNISDVCLFQIDKVYREWSSIALTVSRTPKCIVSAYINGVLRATLGLPNSKDTVDLSQALKADSPNFKVSLPGDLEAGLRGLRVWRYVLSRGQIMSLLSSSVLAYLHNPKHANAQTKRTRSVANHVFLPKKLPYTASLVEGTESELKISESRANGIVTDRYSFDPMGYEMPAGAWIRIRDGLPPRQVLTKDYTLELDFHVDFKTWQPGDDPTTRLLPLVSLNSPSASQFLSPTLPTSRQDPALFLIDRATGTLVIQCSLKTQHISQSPADVPLFDLKNSCVASNIWHRLQLCVCPARVSVHMDAKPLITLSWKGWKDENGGLIAGMRVLRVRNPGGGRDQESEWNESMWESGRLVSFKRQEQRYVLNVRWDVSGKEGEVVWPNAVKVRVVDMSSNALVKPSEGMKCMIQRYENPTKEESGTVWYNGTVTSCEQVREGSWSLQVQFRETESEDVQFPPDQRASTGNIILMTPDILQLNSNDSPVNLGLNPDPDEMQQIQETYPEAYRTLRSMGFPEARCCRALAVTNGDREQAVEWILHRPAPSMRTKSFDFGTGIGSGAGSPSRDEKETPGAPIELKLLVETQIYKDRGISVPAPMPFRATIGGSEAVDNHDEGDIKVQGGKPSKNLEKAPPRDCLTTPKDSSGHGGRKDTSPDSAMTTLTAVSGGRDPKSSKVSGLNHNFQLGKEIGIFGLQMRSSKTGEIDIGSRGSASASGKENTKPVSAAASLDLLRDASQPDQRSWPWRRMKIKWLRIEKNTGGKSPVQACYSTRQNESLGPWNWPVSGLSNTTEKQICTILSNSEGAEDVDADVVHQALVQSSFDLTDAWRLIVSNEMCETLEQIVKASKLSNAVSSLGALGYSVKQCEEALSRSGDQLQPALLWLLDHKVPNVKIGDSGAWSLTKATGISTLYPLFSDKSNDKSRKGVGRSTTPFLFTGDSADGVAGRGVNSGLLGEDDSPDLSRGTTKKAWALHLKDLESLKKLSLQGVKMALLHTELALISRYGISCAIRTMQQKLKDKSCKGSEVLLMFDDKKSNPSKSTSEISGPLFFTKLIRLVHLSQDEIQLQIIRSTLLKSLNDEAKSMLHDLSVNKKASTATPNPSIVVPSPDSTLHSTVQPGKKTLASSPELRARFPVAFAISSEYTLHMFGYIMQKLYPLDAKSRVLEEEDEGDDAAPRVGSKVMVASSGGGYYYKWEVSSADLMDDGRWKLGVRRGASNETYIYPSPSNRIILLPNPPLQRPSLSMRILGRHDAWYPGRISSCNPLVSLSGRWEVHVAYDDGDTDMLTFPGPASHPIILLGDAWNRTQASVSAPKNSEDQRTGEFISVRATDAVVHPSIDLALWIVDLLLDFQHAHSRKSPELLRHLRPLLFSEAVVNAMFEIIRSGGGKKGCSMRLAFVYLLTNLVRTFGHQNLLTIAQVQSLKVFMLDLFLAHTGTNSLKGLVPSPLFQGMVELVLCIARQLAPDAVPGFVVPKEKWFHKLLVADQVLDALQPNVPPSSRSFLPSSFVDPLWQTIKSQWPKAKQMGLEDVKDSKQDNDTKSGPQGSAIPETSSNLGDLLRRARQRVEAQLRKQHEEEKATPVTSKPTTPTKTFSGKSNPSPLPTAPTTITTSTPGARNLIKLRHKNFHVNDSVFVLLPGADQQLVRLLRTYCEKRSLPLSALNVRDFDPTEEELLHCKKLEQVITHLNKTYLQVRLFVLQRMNNLLAPLLETLVDLTQPSSWDTIANKVRGARELIFWSHKEQLWKRALAATMMTGTVPSVNLDRMRAMRLRETGGCDTRGTISVFGQAFRQLRSQNCFRVGSNVRAFKVLFIGEHAIDAGGPYRAAITDMCDELQSSVLPLFIPCPNSREAIGENRDKWVPNPSARRPIQLKMYEFVGKLMGLAMRSGNLLELDLPSVIWKPLVLTKPTMEDLKGIDLICFKILERLSAFDKPGEHASNFEETQLEFTCVRSDQKLVRLVKDGHRKKVTWENRKLYMKLLLKERLNEFRTQCAAIRRGLASVVPASVFTLFTHSELEIAVCGSPVISVDLLQANTTYTYPTKADDRHIKLFWKMMREKFSQEDRVKFLRFVWGRSRHPRDNESWGSEKFHIAPHAASQNSPLGPDEYHPSAHTCFFTLELPEYSTPEVMYSKVLYAITHCTAVDGDATFNAARQIVFEESSSDEEWIESG